MIATCAFWVIAGCSSTDSESSDLLFIAGGSFMMGNPYDTADPDETLIHEVKLDSYFIGKHEVSVGQFQEFVVASGYITTAERIGNATVFVGKKVEQPGDGSWRNPYFQQHPRHPVVCVSWWDAIEYCNWRSDSEGLSRCYQVSSDSSVTWDRQADGYRLATEAEWEYAGRSRGRDNKFTWGDGPPLIDGSPAANTRDESAHAQWGIGNYWEGYDDGYAFTAPVDTMAANAAGMYGVSGNVYEWCWDWYSETYYTESPIDNPAGPSSGELRACRDAGFSCPIYQEVVTSRGKGYPYLAFSWGGFRIARSTVMK